MQYRYTQHQMKHEQHTMHHDPGDEDVPYDAGSNPTFSMAEDTTGHDGCKKAQDIDSTLGLALQNTAGEKASERTIDRLSVLNTATGSEETKAADSRITSGSGGSEGMSFCDLPAEIRNRIYELLLRSDKPLNLEYHCVASGIECPYNDIGGIHLLRTCRSIHEEAASVLYTGNTFVVVQGLNDWIRGPRLDDWLKRVGQNLPLLRRVNIDVANDIQNMRFDDRTVLDVLPLFVRGILTKSPQLRISLSVTMDTHLRYRYGPFCEIVQAAAYARLRYRYGPFCEIVQAAAYARRVNESLQALQKPNCIAADLRTYLQSLRSLAFMTVSIDDDIVVGFRTGATLHYRRSNLGVIERVNKRSPPKCLFDILNQRRLSYRIYRDLVSPGRSFSFDLNDRLSVEAMRCLMNTSWKIREHVEHTIFECSPDVTITLQATATRPCEFQPLHYWMEAMDQKMSLGRYPIWLDVETDDDKSPCWINVTELLRATQSKTRVLNFAVRFGKRSSKLDLEMLRIQFLIFLRDLNIAGLYHPHSPLPIMRMDHEGLITHAEYDRGNVMVETLESTTLSQYDLKRMPYEWYRLAGSSASDISASSGMISQPHKDWELVCKLSRLVH